MGDDEPSARAPRRRPSLAHVAREAAVSPITASRVANGAGNVDAGTRTRVLDVMNRLGYRPNLAARALATGTFNSVGLIAAELQSSGTMATVEAVSTAAAERGFSVTLMSTRPVNSTVVNVYDRLEHEGVDGAIIIAERRLAGGGTISLPPGVPVVFVDAGGDAAYSQVDSDQFGGARRATEHLLALGHQTVHHLAGPTSSYAATRRMHGWQAALEAAGAAVPAVVHGDWSSRSGVELAPALLEANTTAVFAANDAMALGVLQHLHDRGARVPDDVSVVGFDDIEQAAAFWPPLTTIRQHFDQVGQLAVAELLDQIRLEARPAQQLIAPVELVVRGSSGPPPSIIQGW